MGDEAEVAHAPALSFEDGDEVMPVAPPAITTVPHVQDAPVAAAPPPAQPPPPAAPPPAPRAAVAKEVGGEFFEHLQLSDEQLGAINACLANMHRPSRMDPRKWSDLQVAGICLHVGRSWHGPVARFDQMCQEVRLYQPKDRVRWLDGRHPYYIRLDVMMEGELAGGLLLRFVRGRGTIRRRKVNGLDCRPNDLDLEGGVLICDIIVALITPERQRMGCFTLAVEACELALQQLHRHEARVEMTVRMACSLTHREDNSVVKAYQAVGFGMAPDLPVTNNLLPAEDETTALLACAADWARKNKLPDHRPNGLKVHRRKVAITHNPRAAPFSTAAASSSSSDAVDECTVCMDAPASFAFVPCGHRCVCKKCRDSVCASNDAKCPRCRESVSSTLRIYV